MFDMNVTSCRAELRHLDTAIKSECLFEPETLDMTAKCGLEDTKKRGKRSRKFMPKTERWRDNTQTYELCQQTEGMVEFMKKRKLQLCRHLPRTDRYAGEKNLRFLQIKKNKRPNGCGK